MATYENIVLQMYKDSNGDKHIMYPITNSESVDGLEEALAAKQNIITAGTDDPSGGSDGDVYIQYSESGDIIFDQIYPIGSIYMSINSTSPASLFGGTWEQIKDTFLLTAGDTYTAGTTGGEASHVLTVSEMPSHRHNFVGDGSKIIQNDASLVKSGSTYPSRAGISIGSDYSSNGTITIGYTGDNVAHNNMPPYLVVYMWKRTA